MRNFRCAMIPVILCSFVALAAAGDADAQTTVNLVLSGGPVVFDAPTAADMTAGVLESSTPLSFEVKTTSEPGGLFTTTVLIRSSSATLGNGKPTADLEWRRGNETTWHPLTTTDAIVERRSAMGSQKGHTWDNMIFFRVTLHWTSDPPATYTGNLVLTLTTTTP